MNCTYSRKNMETRVYELLEVGDDIPPSTPIRQAISLDREGNVTYTHSQIAYSTQNKDILCDFWGLFWYWPNLLRSRGTAF